MRCLCGCGEEVNERKKYINGGHSMRKEIPWNKKYPDKWKCEVCKIEFSHKGHKRRFCSQKCFGKFRIGSVPWNKGKKGLQEWHNTSGLIKAKKGNTQGFQKGNIPKTAWKKGHKPWNYIDGRSKKQTWNRYGTDWKNIREQVLIRDNKQCQICGKFEGRLEIHHKIPFLINKDNSLSNLITLCAHCHRKVETEITGRLIKMKVKELIEHS